MVSPGTSYRTGPRALVFMMLRKLKYPCILALVMISISVILYFSHAELSHLYTSGSPFVKKFVEIVYAVERYGWIFVALLAVFLSISIIPEYRGLTLTIGENALSVRGGVLTYQEIAIPYRQIQTISIVEEMIPRLFGLCSFIIVTSAHNTEQTNNDESEAVIELIQTPLARELQKMVLSRANSVAR